MFAYAIEACHLNVTDTQSINFVINRFFTTLFKTSDMEVIKYYQMIFKFELPGALLNMRKSKFMDSYKLTDNWLCKYISISIFSSWL